FSPLPQGEGQGVRAFDDVQLGRDAAGARVGLEDLAPDAGVVMAAYRRAARRRGRGQTREPSAYGRVQGAGRPYLCGCADAARAGGERAHFGDARQSWGKSRLRRATIWPD